MSASVNRRKFLRSAAQSAGGLLILANSRSAYSYSANDKLNVALIGVAGRGSWFVGAIPNLKQNVVAMCDVNHRRAEEAFKRIPQAKKYFDFRKMLEEMDKEIEACVIATPDHTHAIITATAMKMGKHVYTEKPLTHDLYEARKLRELAGKCKVATQMGNQGTASRAFRRATDLIWAGVLGDIREVHAWNTGGGRGDAPLPKGSEPVPDYLKWDVWLGPVTWRDYHPEWYKWHGWRDFATGQLGNWASHTMNLIFKGLKLDMLWKPSDLPIIKISSNETVKVKAKVSGIHKATFPRTEIITYDFPARGSMPPLRVNWYNGAGKAPGPRGMLESMMGYKLDWGDAGQKQYRDHAGCLIVGTRGLIHSNGHNTEMKLLPEKNFKDFKDPEPTLPRSRGHEMEWIEACKGGPVALSQFGYAGPLAEFVLLGNIATQFDSQIEFDPQALKITNNDEADKAIKCPRRAGWEL